MSFSLARTPLAQASQRMVAANAMRAGAVRMASGVPPPVVNVQVPPEGAYPPPPGPPVRMVFTICFVLGNSNYITALKWI